MHDWLTERYTDYSAHVLWQGALAGLHSSGDAEVDWHKSDRAPLLIITGSKDHIVPPDVGKAVFEKYKGSAPVEYKEFEGRTHHICGQEGWESRRPRCKMGRGCVKAVGQKAAQAVGSLCC